MPWITISYERSKLYKEVWTEPVTKVAKRYGVSDVALRKTCKKLSVPLPPAGYWARVAAGRCPPKPSLPEHTGPTELVRNRFQSEDPPEPAPPEPPHLIARRAFEQSPENRISVLDKLADPHPLVAALVKSWGKWKFRDSRGWAQVLGGRVLDVSISDSSAPRAFRILDALVKALASRGMPVWVDREGSRRTYVSVQGEDISFRMTEKSTRTERVLTLAEKKAQSKNDWVYIPERYVYHPTGLLSLGIIGEFGPGASLSDGARTKLEDKLNAFIVQLEWEAAKRKRDRDLREQREKLWREEEIKRRELEAKRKQEKEKLVKVEEQAQQWRRARDLREYVQAVETKAVEECGHIPPNSQLGQWLKWVSSKADEIDPICAIRFS